MDEFTKERLELSRERLSGLKDEKLKKQAFDAYFHKTGEFLSLVLSVFDMAEDGRIAEMKEDVLRGFMEQFYSDILPAQYPVSFANPTYAAEQLGESFGKLLSALYYEIRSTIPFAYEANAEQILIRLELFLEVYGSFCSAETENGELPKYEDIHKILYWFYSDYEEDERLERFGQMVAPKEDFARNLIENSDLTDLSYLYRFGEYISDNERLTAQHLNAMTQEEINAMARTYTEGYRIGFETTGKDIKKKRTVSIRYTLGFERMVLAAIQQFKEIGLTSAIYRANPSTFYNANSISKNGFTGGSANKQYEYDHKDDNALFLDGALLNRKIEALRSAGEHFKEEAALFGGPAVIEVFGEKPFAPAVNKDAVHLTAEQETELGKYRIQTSVITNQYIHGEERSFTIISFPVPEIGNDYEAIFNETVRINTLDYVFYRDLQQILIDTLDKASYCVVKGMGDNHTDMRVALHTLTDPAHETNFENCVADVNIPVGEVFTSPVLTGTNGVLHVTSVYLNGFLFKDLDIAFKDGCIASYSCRNFASEEENNKYIEDNILYHHKTLPLGEFAIGTNTTAYVMARKYGIQGKLPILIGEKTGPHFAVGDTCYSYEEDNVICNPDGKNIIAKSNEISDLRTEDPEKAYFGCHTDITIPYDELGEVTAVTKEGEQIPIILNGRFVLLGTEALNQPLEEL